MSEDKNDIVIVQLDRPRVLRFGHKALKILGALTGKDIDALEMGNSFDLEEVEKIMYCGLLSDAAENNEVLKLESMEDLLDKAPSWKRMIEKMQEALTIAFGSLDDLTEENGKNLKRIALEAQSKPKKKNGAG